MRCLSGFAEVPSQVPPWSLPDAPRVPKNKSKEACLVPAPKARWYCKVLAVKGFPVGAVGPYQGQPLSPRKIVFKTHLVPGGKARLSGRNVWRMQIWGPSRPPALLSLLSLLPKGPSDPCDGLRFSLRSGEKTQH